MVKEKKKGAADAEGPKIENGIFYFPNGDRYEGQYIVKDSHIERSGTGCHTTAGGIVYEGQWQGDHMNGNGKIVYPSGSSYEGEFHNNEYNGSGTFRWSDGSFYYGEFRNNKIEGDGEFTDINGQLWKGRFRFRIAPNLKFALLMMSVNKVLSDLVGAIRNSTFHAYCFEGDIGQDSTDYPIVKEIVREEVIHLLRDPKSPWKATEDWSDEAIEMKELTATQAIVLTNDFLYNFTKSLRLISKELVDVDSSLRRYVKLEELILSCNFITDILPENLPDSLLLLELNGNRCSFSTPLQLARGTGPKCRLRHLGLGTNDMYNIDWFQPSRWQSLMSLDFSNNQLTDLASAVEKLRQLPALRSLVLFKNPLSLVAAYRSYVLNKIMQLRSFDDIPAGADEMLHAAQTASAMGAGVHPAVQSAQIHLRISSITGLPPPPPPSAEGVPPVDAFYRLEFVVPAKFFERYIDDASSDAAAPVSIETASSSIVTWESAKTRSFHGSIFLETSGAVQENAPTQTKQTKAQAAAAAERLAGCVERDRRQGEDQDVFRICSPGMRWLPTPLDWSKEWQLILRTTGLAQLRSGLETPGAFKLLVVLIIRSLASRPPSSRPSSRKKDEKKQQDKGKESGGKDSKGQKPGGKKAAAAQVDTGPLYVIQRNVLADIPLATSQLFASSTQATSFTMPGTTIIEEAEHVFASETAALELGGRSGSGKGKKKTSELQLPGGEEGGGSRKGQRKPKEGGDDKEKPAKGAANATAGGTAELEVPPPPPDLQLSASLELLRIRQTGDVQRWTSVNAAAANPLALP